MPQAPVAESDPRIKNVIKTKVRNLTTSLLIPMTTLQVSFRVNFGIFTTICRQISWPYKNRDIHTLFLTEKNACSECFVALGYALTLSDVA